jgi:hypothetical protein
LHVEIVSRLLYDVQQVTQNIFWSRMMSIEVMKRALEALEAFLRFAAIHHDGPDTSDKYLAEDYAVEGFRKARQVLPALRTAIETAEKQEPTGKQSLQVKQEPVAWAEEIIGDLHACYDSEMIKENDSGDALIRLDAAICAVEEAEKRHTTPPAAQPAPLQVSPTDFVDMVMDKENAIGKPLFWAEWPNREKNT